MDVPVVPQLNPLGGYVFLDVVSVIYKNWSYWLWIICFVCFFIIILSRPCFLQFIKRRFIHLYPENTGIRHFINTITNAVNAVTYSYKIATNA